MSELRFPKSFFNAFELNPLAESVQGSIGRRRRGVILWNFFPETSDLAMCNTQQGYRAV